MEAVADVQGKKGLISWKSQTIDLIQEDLDKLEKENIENISSIAKTYADAYAIDDKPVGDISMLRTLMVALEEVEKEITA